MTKHTIRYQYQNPFSNSFYVFQLVMNNTELSNVDFAGTDYLLGLFGETHVEYEDARKEDRDPSLTNMVDAALEVSYKLLMFTRNAF